MDTERTRSWAEFLLPGYAMLLIYLYFSPETVPHQAEGGVFGSVYVWSIWALIGMLAGILAISGSVVGFYLLYSPIYLVSYGNRIAWSHRAGTMWTDRREVQFYVACFFILCTLGGLAFYDATIAAVSFVVLSGIAPLAWRIVCKYRS
jgi:hypothetical protein